MLKSNEKVSIRYAKRCTNPLQQIKYPTLRTRLRFLGLPLELLHQLQYVGSLDAGHLSVPRLQAVSTGRPSQFVRTLLLPVVVQLLAMSPLQIVDLTL